MPIRTIYADISGIFIGVKTLILDTDATAGDSTITVKNIAGAAVNNILCFREPGDENAEIIATHAVTAPTGTTVTLVTTLVRSHPAGTKVSIIRANQVRFYRSATEVNANTDDATLTALAAAQNIDPTLVQNYYDDTTQTSGFYYFRFIDSVNSINDNYSDAIPWGQFSVRFAENEVGYLLEFVRRKLAHDFDERFSRQTAIDEVNACLRYMQGKLKHWGRYLKADQVLGVTSRGVFDFAMPETIYDTETNKSVLQMRIGTAVTPLVPLDEKEFDTLMREVAHTQVRTLAVVGNATLNVDNSYDFSDTGSLHLYTSNAMDAITYTGVTRSTTAGVFTGIPVSGDGSIEAAHAVDVNVWQNEVEGQPRYFNVREGRMRIYPLADSTWINKNVLIDFFEEATAVDSESDTIDANRYDAVKHWLLWQGKNYWRNNGVSDTKDGDFLMFGDILKSAIRTEVSGQKFKMQPKINGINYRTRPIGKFENT